MANDRADTLQRERARFLHRDGIAHQSVGLVCEEDLAGTRRLLQTGRQVHDASGDEGMAG